MNGGAVSALNHDARTILCGFRRFVRETYDEGVWSAVHERADVGGQLFVPVTAYPDRYYYELVDAAAEVTDRDTTALQRGFGRALVDQHLAEDGQSGEDDGGTVEDVHGSGEDDVQHFEDDVHPVSDGDPNYEDPVAAFRGSDAALERLANADEWVEQALGRGGGESSPLALAADRHGEHCVRLTYGSPLGLCTVVEGIVAALADATGADWSVEEVTCMHDGGVECEFVVEATRSQTLAAPAGRSRSPETTD